MKLQKFPLFVLSVLMVACADESAQDPQVAKYVDEAPLPVGWPQPGPYGRVTEKSYPAYRAAFTQGKSETSAFFTLFAHIKQQKIPMTAPVEMSLAEEQGDLKQTGMAFLYQNGDFGQQGANGENVVVRDVPAANALSYTWQGSDSEENRAKAKRELQQALAAQNKKAQGFRLLGYNGPGTPRSRQTWELQAVLK